MWKFLYSPTDKNKTKLFNVLESGKNHITFMIQNFQPKTMLSYIFVRKNENTNNENQLNAYAYGKKKKKKYYFFKPCLKNIKKTCFSALLFSAIIDTCNFFFFHFKI